MKGDLERLASSASVHDKGYLYGMAHHLSHSLYGRLTTFSTFFGSASPGFPAMAPTARLSHSRFSKTPLTERATGREMTSATQHARQTQTHRKTGSRTDRKAPHTYTGARVHADGPQGMCAHIERKRKKRHIRTDNRQTQHPSHPIHHRVRHSAFPTTTTSANPSAAAAARPGRARGARERQHARARDTVGLPGYGGPRVRRQKSSHWIVLLSRQCGDSIQLHPIRY